MPIIEWIKKWLSSQQAVDLSDEELEKLRADFKTRYNHFTRLLTANKRALEIMAEIEEALGGSPPPSMGFVRSRCTRITTEIYQIVRHMDKVSSGKYPVLLERFKAIQKNLEPFVTPPASMEDAALILPLKRLNQGLTDQVGGKMATLGELGVIEGAHTPTGFVVTARAYRAFMDQGGISREINRLNQTAENDTGQCNVELCDRIRRLVEASPVPGDLARAMADNYALLEQEAGVGAVVAMRSSAIGEDTLATSFAGQYESVLDVKADELLAAYKKVVASKYSAQAVSYRLHHGIRDEDVAMCVGCMPMVNAVCGGVAYTGNPVDPADDSLTINAVWGLPQPVVDGTAAADLFVVSRHPPHRIVKREVAGKPTRYIYSPAKHACLVEPTGDLEHAPTLEDDKLLDLVRVLLNIESTFGQPQDVEWAVDSTGALVLLQSRPLARLASPAKVAPSALSAEEASKRLLTGGVTASRGAVAGPLVKARNLADVADIPENSILVVAQPLPYWATLLGRIGGVVSEQGSVTCHLANVAREFRVPALFNVAGAMARLKAGDQVTLDADARTIFSGRIGSVLERGRPQAPPTQDSPVTRALRGAAEHIIPLNLRDPEAPAFSPEGCRTFHDITRFCHEKAVEEMFKFGIDHQFLEKASRKLFTDVATQFLVIDLGDGLVPEANDPYFVKLDQVVSIPMLALWRGMTAVDWEGPPPVDTRGFLQVLAGAAMDPNLDPSQRSAYSTQSYFMVSKNFCSLQSRVGFHFATVEALVGERTRENYISFQFSGGGADLDRKRRRARMIGDILEARNFRTTVHGDAVQAKIEGYDQRKMEEALMAIGYLIIHTRQLDMVMRDAASVALHKRKMTDDIATLISKGRVS